MCRSRAATSISAERPSGKAPTTRVRLRISRIILSSGLLVRHRAPAFQRFRHLLLDKVGSGPQLHLLQPRDDLFGFALGSSVILLGVALSMRATSATFVFGTWLNTLR